MKKKGFFKKIWGFVKSLFTSKAVQKAVKVGIDVVELIKNYVESPLAPVFTALIPGGIDDVIVHQLRYYLPKVLAEFKIADEALRQKGPDAIIQVALQHLKNLTPDERNKKYLHIAAMLSHALSKTSDGGTTLTYEEIKEIVAYTYEKDYNQKP